ncbi:MAG: nucleoside monophosphate kinase [Microgenomates group bacterium]
MNIILFGPQGSGKGTQARLLCDKFGFSYFESGAYLRRLAETHPEMGEIMNSGKLVPDEEFTSYLTAYLDQENLYDNIIFDGFPRTVEQYRFLKIWLNKKQVKIDLAIVLEISESETLKRLGARRQDPVTGKIYNLVTDLPPKEVDVNTLVQRDDDKPEAIKKRLELYHARTEPLISEIENDSKVFRVNGERSIDEIQNDLEKIIENAKN